MIAKTEREIVESVIPKAEIDEITFETESFNNMRVRVNYSIYDKVDSGEIGTWFSQQEYEKYFKIDTTMVATVPEADVNVQIYEDTKTITNIAQQGRDFTLPDGTTVRKFAFEVTHIVSEKVKDLTFQVRTGFDIDALEKSFDIDLSDLFSDAAESIFKETSVTILEEGELKTNIQDFRSKGEMLRIEVDNTGIIESFSQSIEESSRRLEEDRLQANDFLSDFMLTRNAQGEAKFLFTLDAHSFYSKKSGYRKYFNNFLPEEKNEFLQRLEIISLKVTKRRVALARDSLGTTSVIKYSDNEITDVVAETRKPKNNSSFITNRTEKGSIKQVEIEVPDVNGLYFITGTDHHIGNLSTGVYSYGVSFSVVDNMKQILLEKLAVLQDHIRKLKEIYNLMVLPENYDLYTNTSRKSLAQIDVTAESKIREAYSYFCKILFIFTKSYSLPAKVIGLVGTITNSGTPETMEVFIELLEVLMRKSLFDLGESRSDSRGNLTSGFSISTIEVERMYDTPERLFDAAIPNVSGLEYLADFSDYASDEALREISSLADNTGEVGLKTIDAATFERRMLTEVERFFNSSNVLLTPNLNQGTSSPDVRSSVTSHGSEYLTPSAMFRGEQETPVITSNISDVQSASSAQKANIFITGNLENISKLAGTSLLLPTKGSPEATFMSGLGVGFYDSEDRYSLLKSELGKKFSLNRRRRIDERTERRKRASEILVEKVNREFENFVFSKMKNIISGPELGTEKTLKNTPRQDNMNRIAVSTPDGLGVSITDFERTPNPMKALSLGIYDAASESRMNLDAFRQGTYSVSLSFITKLEYLSGFENSSDGQRLVFRPIFAPMTLDIYRENKSKNLLCRINKYSLNDFGVRTSASRIPIYDSVFIVRPVEEFDRVVESRVFEDTPTAAELAGVSYAEFMPTIQSQLEEINRQINDIGITNDTLAVGIIAANSTIEENNTQIRSIDSNLTRLNREIHRHYNNFSQRQLVMAEIERLTQEKDALLFNIAVKEGEITELNEDIAENEGRIRELEAIKRRLEEYL